MKKGEIMNNIEERELRTKETPDRGEGQGRLWRI